MKPILYAAAAAIFLSWPSDGALAGPKLYDMGYFLGPPRGTVAGPPEIPGKGKTDRVYRRGSVVPAGAGRQAPATIAAVSAVSNPPAAARSPRRRGYYGSGMIGFGFVEEAKNTSSGLLDADSDYDVGINIGGSVGFVYGNGFRAELEIAYRQYDVDSLTVTRVGNISGLSIGGFDADGDVSVLAFMANAAYDFDFGMPFTPFVLAGFGPAIFSINDVKSLGVDVADDSDLVLAFQFGVGATIPFRDRWLLEASYRYFATTDPELKDAAGDPFDSEFASHNFLLTARYAL